MFTNLPIGSFVVKIAAGELGDGASLKQPLLVPLWRARNSMSLMISKAEKSALCNRVWGNDFTSPALKVPQGVKYADRGAFTVGPNGEGGEGAEEMVLGSGATTPAVEEVASGATTPAVEATEGDGEKAEEL